MSAKTHIAISSRPDVNLRVKFRPLDFEFAGEATIAMETSQIHASFDEIPVTVAIPFLRRRVIAGSVGPFGVRIKPFEAKLRVHGLQLRGKLGDECIEGDLHAVGDCKAEIEATGKLVDQVVRAALNAMSKD